MKVGLVGKEAELRKEEEGGGRRGDGRRRREDGLLTRSCPGREIGGGEVGGSCGSRVRGDATFWPSFFFSSSDMGWDFRFLSIQLLCLILPDSESPSFCGGSRHGEGSRDADGGGS